MNVPIKRPGAAEPIAYFKADKTTMFTHALMGEHKIVAAFQSPVALGLQINDYIDYYGEVMTIYQPVQDKRLQSRLFEYNVTFEGIRYKLYDKLLLHLGTSPKEYFGTPADLIDLIIENINSIDPGWSRGTCEDLPPQNVQFSDSPSCRVALTNIADQFKLEWFLTGKTIHLVKQAGDTTAIVLKYGRGNGLYTLQRNAIENKPLVTRLYGFGSTRNIPADYRGGIGRLTFEDRYIDKNVDVYGVKEGIYTNEEIYPKYEGNISAVSAYDAEASTFTITDADIDFNVKEAILPGIEGKVQFLTGELTGQEFVIVDWDNATKTVKLKVFVDDKNKKLPNDVFYPAIGDTFNFLDIGMPASYIEDAEEEIQAATEDAAEASGIPNVSYALEIDILNVKRENTQIGPGDKVTVEDTAMGVNKLIRVNSVSYPAFFREYLEEDSQFNAVIADFITYNTQERNKYDMKKTEKAVKYVDRTNAERARRSANNLRTLQSRIFNADNTLSTDPESITAGMAAFGYDSQNYSLNGVIITPNVAGDENSLIISDGQLIHRIYNIPGLGYTWVMNTNVWSGLDPDKFYYLYAKCSKTALTGTWEISETPVGVNDIVGYLAFNLGLLYEVNSDDYRVFESTKGVTFIVGDQITTGRVKDLSGQNYFDLTAGTFNLGDANNGIDFNVTTPNELTIKNAIASKTVKVGDGGVVNAGITGVTDAGDSSVRFWAGAEEADKGDAPFRVTKDGHVVMTQADISGIINSVMGKIGNFLIDSTGLKQTADADAYIIQEKTDGTATIIARAAIGTNVASGFNLVGDFRNHFTNPSGPNHGVRVSVRNGSSAFLSPEFTGNFAFDIEGDISMKDGNLVTDNSVKIYFKGTDVYLGNLPVTETKAGFGTVMRRNSDGKLFLYYD